MSLPALENNMLVPGFADALAISKERAAVKNSVDASAGPGGQAAVGSFMLAVSNIMKTGLVTQKVYNRTGSTISKGKLLSLDTSMGSPYYKTAEGAICVALADAGAYLPAYWVAHEDIPDGAYSDVTSTILCGVSQDLSGYAAGMPLFLQANGNAADGPSTPGYWQLVGFVQNPGTDNGDSTVAFHILPAVRYTT